MNETNNILEISEADFNDQVIEASTSKLIIVDFWAPWCGPCKQLTPKLEEIAKKSADKITLVKINIDENQQIAGQLRIQSIPTVYAFKDKQIVNAFQGVIGEKQIIDFIEKSLGSKLSEDFSEFYIQIENEMSNQKYEESRDILIDFISNNSKEVQAINLYLQCLIELKQFEEVESFISSLEKDIQEKEEIKQILKKLEIIKSNQSGPSIEDLNKKLKNKPDDINLIINIADKYFSMQNYDDCMDILLQNYSKNKNVIKKKMVEFFEVLGDSNDYTIRYRKKLSQVMFS